MVKKSAPLIVGLIAAVLMPAEVRAQRAGFEPPAPPEERRPYRGLFGGPGDPSTPQSLILTASLFGAYDDNVTAELSNSNRVDPRLQRSGEYYGGSAGLNYSIAKTVDRVNFGLSSGATASTYRFDDDSNLVPHAFVTGNVRFPIARRSYLRLNQQVVYSRYYRFQLFPSLIGPDDDGALTGDPDLELFERTSLRYIGGLGFQQELGRRSSLTADYRFGLVDYREDQYADWRSHSAAVGFRRQLTSNASLNLGYGYRTAESSTGDLRPRELHDLNIGVDYSRALSFSRRTSFRFGTGSSILVMDRLDTPASDPRTRFHLLGNAALTHEIGRTWTAFAMYNRGLLFREGFDDPFLTDAVSTGLTGFFSRRLDAAVIARWAYASQDAGRRGSYDSLVGSAQARYALSSYLAIYARYVYYQYTFGDDIVLAPGLARSLDRQGVRVGLTASVPLIR